MSRFKIIYKNEWQEIMRIYQDFIFAKLNVDENQAIASHYKITSIPTILFIKNGIVVNKIVGALPYANMKKFLEKLKSSNN